MRRPVPATVLAAALAVSALAGCSAGVKRAAVKAGGTSTTTTSVKGHQRDHDHDHEVVDHGLCRRRRRRHRRLVGRRHGGRRGNVGRRRYGDHDLRGHDHHGPDRARAGDHGDRDHGTDVPERRRLEHGDGVVGLEERRPGLAAAGVGRLGSRRRRPRRPPPRTTGPSPSNSSKTLPLGLCEPGQLRAGRGLQHDEPQRRGPEQLPNDVDLSAPVNWSPSAVLGGDRRARAPPIPTRNAGGARRWGGRR